MGGVLSPRVVVFQHQIIAQLGSIFELQQAIRLLKSDLFNEIYCIRCGKHNADMTDHKRIVRFRELIVQDYGDKTDLIIVHEGETAFLPFLLNRFPEYQSDNISDILLLYLQNVLAAPGLLLLPWMC